MISKWIVVGLLLVSLISISVMTGSMPLPSAQAVTTAIVEAYSVYWGDLHTHTSFSNDARELQLIRYHRVYQPDDALAYARDVSQLDFAVIADHAEDSTAEKWSDSQEMLRDFATANPTGPIPFLGFEYTNSTTAPGHGHRIFIFPSLEETQLPTAAIGYDVTAAPNVASVWAQLGNLTYIDIPHHPAKGLQNHGPSEVWNHSTDWTAPYVNSLLQPLVEIYSVHGNSERAGCEEAVIDFQSDTAVEAALQLWLIDHNPAYKLGILGSTDNHLSHPGAVSEVPDNVVPDEGPYTGGLAAVWATDKSREAIWEALLARRTYATSGPRIQLEFTASTNTNTVMMGGTLALPGAGNVQLQVRAKPDSTYTTTIQDIKIIKDGTSTLPTSPAVPLGDGWYGITFTDTAVADESYYRAKVWQAPTLRVDETDRFKTVMASERAWSSPIWVEMATTYHCSFQPNWNMLSLPLETSNDPLQVFTNVPAPWVLFQWDPSQNRYLSIPEIAMEPGAGYWLKSSSVSTSTSFTVRGLPYSQPELHVPLIPGWNMIGSPYLTSVDWTAVRIQVGVLRYTLDEAAAALLIAPYCYYWNGSGYVDAKSVGQFDPGKGYWLKALQVCQLVFPKP